MSKILIVEDDENILELEKDYIEASNMEAQGATNGNDGLELALNNDYDLILLDVMLPGINGFDICKNQRNKEHARYFRYRKERRNRQNFGPRFWCGRLYC